MPRGNITPLCARAGLLMVLGLYGWDLGPMVWLASLCDSRLRIMGCLAPGVFGFLILLFVVLVGSLSLLGFLMLLVSGGLLVRCIQDGSPWVYVFPPIRL